MSGSLIDRLPEECKLSVVRLLDREDAANLRLTSKDWARLGAYGLVEDCSLVLTSFTCIPTKIQQLCTWPWMAAHIRTVEVRLGNLDLENVRDEAEVRAEN